MSHTPGPWTLWDFSSDPKLCGYFIRDNETGEVICKVNPYTFPDPALHNAKLITASPDLLRALEELISPDMLAMDRSDLRFVQAVEKARRVIRKARDEE